MAKKKPETKRGAKTRAGQLLSQFLRSIAEEQTEFIKDDDGEDKMASKAEALARKMWKMALGYEEKQSKGNEEILVEYKPDKSMMRLLFDRIEGRVPTVDEAKDPRTTADKVTEQGKKRIADAGKVDV